MKQDPDHRFSASSDDRWIDAALCEHARLGRGDDEELVLRVLRETVHRPVYLQRSAATSLGWRTVASLGIGVAALAAIALLVLSSLPSKVGSVGGGIDEELRFSIRIETPRDGQAPPRPPAPPRLVPESRSVAPDAIAAGASESVGKPTVSVARLDLVSPSDFAAAPGTLPRKSIRHESVRIRADRSESGPGGLVYSGEVVVEHEAFRLFAETVRLSGSGDESSPALVAIGVRLEQKNPPRLAVAESLRFDPASGTLELGGVSRFECEKGTLARFARGDRLRLEGDGFSIENAPVEIHASPLPPSRP